MKTKIFSSLYFSLLLSSHVSGANENGNNTVSKPPDNMLDKSEARSDVPSFFEAPISSEYLWDEVISSIDSPRTYDWRKASWELEFGADDVDERTVFRSSGFHVGIGIPLSNGLSIRTGIRRISVRGTMAGDLLEKTPFRQPAQPTRYEVFGLLGYSLAEGRAFTRISPLVGDCEHVLSVEGGGHYVHPSSSLIPKADPVSVRVNGQLAGSSTWVAHAGVRYAMYIPNGLGFFITPSYEIPIARIEGGLTHWYTFSFGMVASFSDKPTIPSRRSSDTGRKRWP